MATITQKTYEPTEQTKRIIELAQEAHDGALQAKRQIHTSVEIACKCGALLNAEQKKVSKELGRGYWLSYFEATFSKHVAYSTARRWMGLAITNKVKAEVLTENKNRDAGAKELQNFDPHSEHENIIRRGMLALDMFPKKTHIVIEADRPTPQLHSHLAIINRFKSWRADFAKANNHKPMTGEQRTQLRQDFREVIEFCNELTA